MANNEIKLEASTDPVTRCQIVAEVVERNAAIALAASLAGDKLELTERSEAHDIDPNDDLEGIPVFTDEMLSEDGRQRLDEALVIVGSIMHAIRYRSLAQQYRHVDIHHGRIHG